MKLSMWTSYFVELSPEDAIRTLADQGWPFAELSSEHSQTLVDRQAPTATGRAFAGLAQDVGIGIPQGHLKLGADIADDGRWPDELDTLKVWLDLYLAIGIRHAVLHPGGYRQCRDGVPREAVRERQVSALSVLTSHLRGSDLSLCLENGGKWFSSADELLDLIRAAGGQHLAICLDTGHLNLNPMRGDPLDFIRAAGDSLQALHIADNDGSSDQHRMPFGHGSVDWGRVMQGLQEIEYDGLFNFEIPGERRIPEALLSPKLDYIRQVGELMLTDFSLLSGR